MSLYHLGYKMTSVFFIPKEEQTLQSKKSKMKVNLSGKTTTNFNNHFNKSTSYYKFIKLVLST